MTFVLMLGTWAFLLWVGYRTLCALRGDTLDSSPDGVGEPLPDLWRLEMRRRQLSEMIDEIRLDLEAGRTGRDELEDLISQRVQIERTLEYRIGVMREKFDYTGQIDRDLAALMRRLQKDDDRSQQGKSGRSSGLMVLGVMMSCAGLAQAQPAPATAQGEEPCLESTEIVAERVITAVELYESYLVVEQSWSLATTDSCIVQPSHWASDGLVFELPRGARGVHLMGPDTQGVQVEEERVVFRGAIGPSGSDGTSGSWLPTLSIRFSLPNESSCYRYRQTMPVRADEITVIIPQQAEHTRYPRLDVELWVPLCGESTNGRDVACFRRPVERGEGWTFLSWLDRRVAGGGHGDPGSVLLFETRGWPEPHTGARITATLGGGLVGLLSLLWAITQILRFKRAREGLSADASDEQRRWALLSKLFEIQRSVEQGRIQRFESEIREVSIRSELEDIYRRLSSAAEDNSPSRTDSEQGEESSS